MRNAYLVKESQRKPEFGSPPPNGYLIALIGTYISFSVLKIVSLTTMAAILKKIDREQKISCALFAAATVVVFAMIYSMSGLKPIMDYYLSYGDQGIPLVGILTYGVPSFLFTMLTFGVVWKLAIDRSEKIPFVWLSIYITFVNLASFMAIDNVYHTNLKQIRAIHIFYLSILLAMLIFFANKYKVGFLTKLSHR